jgi:hypothetical protein
MDSIEMRSVPRADRVKTALWSSDMEEVLKVIRHLEGLSKGVDGELIVVRDDGEELAMVWWDNESETWLCNWLRGSGA